MTKQLKTSRNPFTLIEIMMVILVLGILLAILLPMLAQSKEHAQVVICMSNMRQVAMGFKNYKSNFDGALPDIEYWLDDFSPYHKYTRKSDEVFTCPKTHKPQEYVWDEEGNLRNGDFLCGGTIEDIEKHSLHNAGHGNNPYHFDPSNPSPGTKAMMAAKRSDRIIFEKYWGLHHKGKFFNVIHLNDLHYEKCESGVAEYWTLNDKGWIDTSLDPFPEDTRIFTMDTTTKPGGGGGKPPKPPKK